MSDEFERQKKNFCKEIEALKSVEPTMSYMECILCICEQYDVEMENVKNLLTKPILDKFKAEAIQNNQLKEKMNTLI